MDISELARNLLQERRSTPALIAQALRLAILRGQLAPGQSLRQEELAKLFGFSRVPVREALRQLEAEGLIISYPHCGSTVAVLTADDVEEVFLIRGFMETAALRFAVPKMSDVDFHKAEAVLKRTDADPDPTHTAELNWDFHEVLYRPCGLPRLLGMLKNLNLNTLRYHYVAFVALRLKAQSQDQHREILSACQAGDVEAAVAALGRHLSESSQSIVSHLREMEKARQAGDPH